MGGCSAGRARSVAPCDGSNVAKDIASSIGDFLQHAAPLWFGGRDRKRWCDGRKQGPICGGAVPVGNTTHGGDEGDKR